MGKKCIVWNCKTGYASQKKLQDDKIPLYKFPKDPEQRKKWVQNIPNKTSFEEITENHAVCALHFRENVPLKKVGRYWAPTEPPQAYKNDAPKSQQSTPAPNDRATKRSLAEARRTVNAPTDEYKLFMENDQFKLVHFHLELEERGNEHQMVAHSAEEDKFTILSVDRCGPVHNFCIYFTIEENDGQKIKNISYEAYTKLKRVRHPLFPNNVSAWSMFDELIHFVRDQEINTSSDSSTCSKSKKNEFILHQIELLNTPRNQKVYDKNDLYQAFSWYTVSTSLYNHLRSYIQLPAKSTLQNITRIAKNTKDESLFQLFFDKQREGSKNCIIIVDEVYVKASLTYSSGSLFGYAADQEANDSKLASTLLCIMIKCFFTYETLIVSMTPCHALTADFLFKEITNVVIKLESCGGKVHGVICDNNRVNQKCFSMFTPQTENKLWKVNHPADADRPLFLIYDPVHLIKNVRNNWMTEKLQTLKFYDSESQEQFACWSHLKELFHHETKTITKLSKLTSSSVSPSNLEKQKVALALNVFCDQTAAALTTSEKKQDSWNMTAMFILKVVKLWKVFNCKSRNEKHRLRDDFRVPIDSDEENKGMVVLKEWANAAKSMTTKQGTSRQHCFTRDTGKALYHTCSALMDISTFLLSTTTSARHDYVLLGFFQQDDLEAHFGHFRMAAGCNFFITVQDVFSTHSIDKAKLMLKYCDEIERIPVGHECAYCKTPLTEEEVYIIDEIPNKVDSISKDEKLSLFYIAGYIAAKNQELCGEMDDFDVDVTSFLETLNRGGLKYPKKVLFELCLFAFIFFMDTPERLCRNRFISIVENFPALYHIDIVLTKDPLKRLGNIFMKRFSQRFTGTNNGQARRKIQKLSSCQP